MTSVHTNMYSLHCGGGGGPVNNQETSINENLVYMHAQSLVIHYLIVTFHVCAAIDNCGHVCVAISDCDLLLTQDE